MTRVSDYGMESGTLPGMKIRIDTEACTGHGRCYTLAPALFDCDDEGFGQVIDEDVAPDHEADARRAVSSCPERAILLEA
jgi:ferredoxin